MGVEAHRSGRQHDPAEARRPAGRVALDADVERRLRTVRRGDGARRALAVSRAPALGEPGGRIVVERIGARKDQFAVAGDRAQHRVGKRRERGAGRIGARRLDGEVDRRMIGRIEKQDLRRGDDEHPFEGAAALRHPPFHPPRQRLADRAEPAQRNGRDRARERPVARVEAARAQRKVGGEPLLERARKRQRFGDRARRRDPRRHARRRRRRRLGTPGMKSARLSRQTTLASNQNCRPPILSLYAKSAAGLRQAGGGRRGPDAAGIFPQPEAGGERSHERQGSRSARPPAGRRAGPPRDLPPAARRALEEAAARRAEPKPAAPREFNGRGGPDPVRYGDWEVKGLASDF